MTQKIAPEQPKVAIYARQSVHEEQGIKQQIDDCLKEASYRGWQVVATYPDDGTSCSKERGPGTKWAKLLKDFDDGLFSAVLVNDVDRLTRNLTDVLEVRPPKRDMRVLTVRGGIDTDDPTHDFSLKLLVLMAEREVKQKAQRTQRYSVERRKSGHPTPGRTPHGYRWVPAIARDEHGTRYRIDPDEAADVRYMFSEFLGGASLGQIARDLNTNGRRTRTGARWLNTTVRKCLMNPQYAALLAPSQETGKFDIDIALLNSQRAALDRRESMISSLIVKGKMGANAAEDALDELAEQRRTITAEIARTVSTDPLAEVVASGNARAWWENASLARRRAVVKVLMTVLIKPVGKGKRITRGEGEETFDAVEPTVGFEWHEKLERP